MASEDDIMAGLDSVEKLMSTVVYRLLLHIATDTSEKIILRFSCDLLPVIGASDNAIKRLQMDPDKIKGFMSSGTAKWKPHNGAHPELKESKYLSLLAFGLSKEYLINLASKEIKKTYHNDIIIDELIKQLNNTPDRTMVFNKGEDGPIVPEAVEETSEDDILSGLEEVEKIVGMGDVPLWRCNLSRDKRDDDEFLLNKIYKSRFTLNDYYFINPTLLRVPAETFFRKTYTQAIDELKKGHAIVGHTFGEYNYRDQVYDHSDLVIYLGVTPQSVLDLMVKKYDIVNYNPTKEIPVLSPLIKQGFLYPYYKIQIKPLPHKIDLPLPPWMRRRKPHPARRKKINEDTKKNILAGLDHLSRKIIVNVDGKQVPVKDDKFFVRKFNISDDMISWIIKDELEHWGDRFITKEGVFDFDQYYDDWMEFILNEWYDDDADLPPKSELDIKLRDNLIDLYNIHLRKKKK